MQIELSSIDVLKAFGFEVEHEENVLYQSEWGEDYHDVLTISWQGKEVLHRVVEWPDSPEKICQLWFVNKLLGNSVQEKQNV